MGFAQSLKKLLGFGQDLELRRLQRIVNKINKLEDRYASMNDAELSGQTDRLRQRVSEGASLESILPEAFAVVREAGKRTLSMRHFDVQLMGGIVLHEGKIAEMHTGEGKTLVATLAVYLNALAGKSIHVVTVNPYLADRDAKWMGPLYAFLGLSVGVSVPKMTLDEKKQAYAADVTYSTNNELGFDYLRDNMAFSLDDKVQRHPDFVIVDEVDSILIDEARTPLIISGRLQDSTALYGQMNRIVPKLTLQAEGEDAVGDYTLDEKSKQVHLTETGLERVETLLNEAELLPANENLYSANNLMLLHHVNAALRAHALYKRDEHYVVTDGQVVIIDEHTGRAMPGRRWSEGLHQAVEAKEGVEIQSENQTLASITFQNYFRQYDKIAGMTGTAQTEAQEFRQIYGLGVVSIPTHHKNIRDDAADLIFATQKDKFSAIVDSIKQCREKNQPVLMGTTSIEVSEHLSKLLKKEKIPHQVLNAKHHEQEAQIITEAGVPGTVTIATNMAGRGTDIVLGGNLEAEKALLKDPSEAELAKLKSDWQQRHDTVIKAGGLHVMGSERHESRRIDNQLRGRCGRQGDPGSTQFYLSLEDNLMRIFASDRMKAVMKKLGLEGSQSIKSPMVSRAIENAQRKVEAYNFDIRKQLLEFDDVANDQRRVIYAQRTELMKEDDITDFIDETRQEVFESLVFTHCPMGSIEEQWDVPALTDELKNDFLIEAPVQSWLDADGDLDQTGVATRIVELINDAYAEKVKDVDPKVARRFEKAMVLQILDTHWKEHLAAMDHLRRSVSLRGYAHKDPKQEYKREAFDLFSSLLDTFRYETCVALSKFKVANPSEVDALEAKQREQNPADMQLKHPSADSSAQAQPAAGQPVVRQGQKIGRNDPCHCGSGKKFKQCHGKLASNN